MTYIPFDLRAWEMDDTGAEDAWDDDPQEWEQPLPMTQDEFEAMDAPHPGPEPQITDEEWALNPF